MSGKDEIDIEYSSKSNILDAQYITEETFQNVSRSEELRCIWSEEAASNLIELYKEFAPLIGKIPNCRSQKSLWKCLCTKLQERGFMYTPDQVANKWKVLKRTYKAVIDNKRKYGSVHQDELEEILGKEMRKSSGSISFPENSLSNNDDDDDDNMNIEKVTFVEVPQILNVDEWPEIGNKSTPNNIAASNNNTNNDSNDISMKNRKIQSSSLLLIKRQMDLYHKERMAIMRERNLLLEKRNKLKSDELALQREKEKNRHDEKMALLRLLKDYLQNRNDTIE